LLSAIASPTLEVYLTTFPMPLHKRVDPNTELQLIDPSIGEKGGQWYENPAPQWIIPMSGRWFVGTMDGHRVEMGPGDASLGEDQGSSSPAARARRRRQPSPTSTHGARSPLACRRWLCESPGPGERRTSVTPRTPSAIKAW
jgi:hypothetical protein